MGVSSLISFHADGESQGSRLFYPVGDYKTGNEKAISFLGNKNNSAEGGTYLYRVTAMKRGGSSRAGRRNLLVY